MANVSGTWLGTYWQWGVPTRFEATLVQTSNNLVGNILDDSSLGEAQVNGEVIGRSIRFTKTYIAASPSAVIYTGTLTDSEDFMQGQWVIGSYDSGTWEARRQGEDLMADLFSRIDKQVPVNVS